jgi:hypothetical protein
MRNRFGQLGDYPVAAYLGYARCLPSIKSHGHRKITVAFAEILLTSLI